MIIIQNSHIYSKISFNIKRSSPKRSYYKLRFNSNLFFHIKRNDESIYAKVVKKHKGLIPCVYSNYYDTRLYPLQWTSGIFTLKNSFLETFESSRTGRKYILNLETS